MAAQDVQGMLVRIEATTAQLRAEMKRADAAVGNATKGIDKQLSKVDGAFGRLEAGAGKAASAIRTLAPALAGLATIEALRRTQQLGEEFTLLEARVKRLSGGTAEAAVTYARLAEVARNSGTSLGDTVKLWESLTGTLHELGATDAQVVRLTDTLQKIGVIGGSSAQEVSAALRQLGQGLAGGVIRAEEFNSVIEGMPELGREIARGLGVPFGELRQLMLDGELTSERVLGAIQKRAVDVDAEFAKLPRTVAQASNALTNDLGRAISALDKAIGGSTNLARFLDTLAKGIRLTAGDLTDFERLNELLAERARVQQSLDMAERRTLLSAKERAAYDDRLKKLNGEILEIQNRRVQQQKDEAKEIKATGAARNEEYDKYLAKLKDSAALHGANTEVAKVRYAIEKGELGKLTEAQQQALLRYAQEKDAKVEAAKAGTANAQAAREQAAAIDGLIAKYDPAAKAQAEYEKGIALADEALLKNKYTTEQYQKVVQGLYTDLNKPIWDKQNEASDKAKEALKKLDDQLESVRDRLDPVRAATKRLTAEKELLKEALDKGRISFEEYTQSVALLDKEYDENTRATSEWAQWTESALERVDAAFADAWRNIGDGFSSFRDSLTDAFKQMLAELAHLAITRPIVMQIGAALGIGGGAGQAVSMLGGSAGSGGMDVFGLLRNGYSIANSGFGQSVAAGWNSGQGVFGGLKGAASAGWNYGSTTLGSLFGGSSAAGAMVNGTYQLGASTMPATVDLIGNTVSQGGNIVGTASGMTSVAPTWGSAATGLGSIAGGLSGAYMGYQRSGIKGAVAGGLGGWGGGTLGTMAGAAAASALSGTAMGAALGSVLPGIGTVIGAALGAAFGSKLFGGAWETKDAGLAFSVTDGDFLGQQYEYQKKKGGLFSSNKKRTRFSALDEETAAQFQAAFDATEDTVSDLLARIGVSVNDGALDGLEIARRKISTKGKTEEEISAAIAEWFEFAGDRMIAEIDKGVGGFGYSLEELTRRINVFEGVNDSLELINVAVLDLSAHSMELANGIAEAAGGMDALSANVATYYGAFFSAAEQQEKTLQQLLETFDDAGITIAKSRSEYREMVEAIDVTTESGSELFNTLMALSGQAAQYYDILEQQGAALIGAAGSAYAALQRSIANQQQEIQRAASSTASAINALTGVSNSLDAALKRLRGSSDDTVRMLRAQAVMTLNSALVTARAGGSLADYAGLQDALDVASNMDTSLYRSLEDFEREQGRTANLIAELEKVNGKQLSAEQKMLEQYEKQLSKLDEQLAFAQSQLDALNGIDNSIMGVAAAIAAMNASVVAALQGLPKGAAQANTPQNNRSIIDTIYQSVLGRGTEGDEAGAAFWANALQNGTATYQDIAASIAKGALGNSAESAATKKSAEQYLKGLGIPGFASGGMHLGGAAIVGEKGPELMVSGPARIYNASQTAAMLGGGGDAAKEVRALRNDFAGMMDALRSVAKHTMKTAQRVEFLERWDYDGLPEARAV